MGVAKWRDTLVDPFRIRLNNDIFIDEILGYPYAGNDVFEIKGRRNGTDIYYYLKTERGKFSNLELERQLIEAIRNPFPLVPEVLDHGTINNIRYLVLKRMYGIKLTDAISEQPDKEEAASKYMFSFGATLGILHNIKFNCPIAFKKDIYNIPNVNMSEFNELFNVMSWLNTNKPVIDNNTFIHGDFNNTNVLFQGTEVSGVLDFENAGLGFKELDIAGAIVERPNQNYKLTSKIINEFLRGYSTRNTFNKSYLNWSIVNICTHYYVQNKSKDAAYANRLMQIMYSIIM